MLGEGPVPPTPGTRQPACPASGPLRQPVRHSASQPPPSPNPDPGEVGSSLSRTGAFKPRSQPVQITVHEQSVKQEEIGNRKVDSL